MEKETPLPYKIKLELKTEEERTFLRIALQKAHACAFGAIMDSRNDSELDEKTKQFNIERFSREMRLYARLLARLADATDEAEPWRAAGAGAGAEEGRVRVMEEEKASNNLADNQDCRGIVEKHYQNNILAMHIKVQILGLQKTRDVLKWIALFSRRFYLDFIDDKSL